MSNFTKSAIAFGVVAGIFGLAAFFGYTPFLKVVQQAVGSPSGSTFNSAKVAEVILSPISTIAGTSTSLYNSDSSDRVIDEGFVSCATSTGSVYDSNPQTTGLAAWNFKFATTTVSSLGLQGNTNYAINMNVGTSSTDNEYAASSTQPAAIRNRFWPSGTYLTVLSNATSSNQTLSCQIGVYYHGS